MCYGDLPLTAARRAPTQLAWKGEEYEVWIRQDDLPVPAQHLGLGNEVDPAAVPACTEVRRLATEAGPNGSLIAAGVASQPIALELGSAELSGGLVTSPAGATYRRTDRIRRRQTDRGGAEDGDL